MAGPNSELLNLAAKAGQLASQVSPKEKIYRNAGRLARSPHDIDVLSEAIVQQASAADLFGDFLRRPEAFLLLHCALHHVSYRIWEHLWNEAHPDRFGEAWDGEDFALMSVWRDKVRDMIQECRQEFIFVMTANEYLVKLNDAGANDETAEELADWMSEVMYEEPMESAN